MNHLNIAIFFLDQFRLILVALQATLGGVCITRDVAPGCCNLSPLGYLLQLQKKPIAPIKDEANSPKGILSLSGFLAQLQKKPIAPIKDEANSPKGILLSLSGFLAQLQKKTNCTDQG